MFSFKRRVGNLAEKLAREYLEQKGFVFIETNFLTKVGEIDIVMINKEVLVFVEVRYKKEEEFNSAISSVNTTKQRKLIRTAHTYLQQHREYCEHIYRFDVVGVSGNLKYPSIKHIENAIIY